MRRTDRWLMAGLMLWVFLIAGELAPVHARSKKVPKPSPLEEYVRSARDAAAINFQPSPGSLYTSTGRFGDLGRDLRASQIGDLVTVVVSDTASAVSSGVSNSSRKSAAKASIPAIAGAARECPGAHIRAGAFELCDAAGPRLHQPHQYTFHHAHRSRGGRDAQWLPRHRRNQRRASQLRASTRPPARRCPVE